MTASLGNCHIFWKVALIGMGLPNVMHAITILLDVLDRIELFASLGPGDTSDFTARSQTNFWRI
jgi:hypothetical protein